ncbi:MAG: damage-inducible protein DinB [Mesorhizobium sp.]|uniref:DinB family protein n=1 Tax=Mesorhizobium sp. TaxID=1871066 RepID=UPI0011FAC6D7|nr:DinB family protein [Mesorhizobium sp.]TIM15536.1 MAG: damage-inducible protein DinB [Mesorhizobium sp.]
MDLLDHLRRMARNNLWSNDRLYSAVLQLEPGEFEAERTSFFPSIKATLNHILAVDHLSAHDLDRRVVTDRREDGKIPERIGDLLAHLFTHDIHHRGQVHAMLSGTSVKPPQLDEFFLDYDLKLRKAEVERLAIDGGN